MTAMRYSWGTMIAFLAAVAPVRAGYVQTTSGRLEGVVVIHADRLTVGGKDIAWADVLFLSNDSVRKSLPRSQWVHLRNGESWAVQVVGTAGQELEVHSDLFGAKKLDLAGIAALEFAAGWDRIENPKSGILYRAKGEPVPGKLLAIKQNKVTFDSIVGEIDLPRDDLVGFRFVDDRRPVRNEGEDEVTLIDGSVFWGKLLPSGDGLKLVHPTLGTLKLPFPIVRSLVRHTPRLLDLTELSPSAVETVPLLAAEETIVPLVRPLRQLEDKPYRQVKGLAISPQVVVRFALPERDKGKGQLLAVLLPLAESRGGVRLCIRAGKKTLLEKEVSTTAKAEPIALEVNAGDVLEIRVDFGSPLRFPCGMVLGDPHVLWEKP